MTLTHGQKTVIKLEHQYKVMARKPQVYGIHMQNVKIVGHLLYSQKIQIQSSKKKITPKNII